MDKKKFTRLVLMPVTAVAVALVIFFLAGGRAVAPENGEVILSEPEEFRGRVDTLPTAPPPDPNATPEIIPEGGVN